MTGNARRLGNPAGPQSPPVFGRIKCRLEPNGGIGVTQLGLLAALQPSPLAQVISELDALPPPLLNDPMSNTKNKRPEGVRVLSPPAPESEMEKDVL